MAEHQSSRLSKLIRGEMEAHGAIPFARFMELALYAPDLGYYERDDMPIGRGGDFYTSVSVGSLFGAMLAFQFATWTDEARERMPDAGCRMPVQLVEAGAHDGRLAADILGWLRKQRPDLGAQLGYWIIDPSTRRRAWQEKTLAEFAPCVRWAESVGELPDTGYRIIFCNELLDAFPVHRLGWDAPEKRWFEWGVGCEQDRLVWKRLPLRVDLFTGLPLLSSDLRAVLPDSYTIEVSLAAEQWWREAATSLGFGKLLAIDYGLTEEEVLAPHRTQGTLRAYRHHRPSQDLLATPGEQDLTAHVNFTALQRAGEVARLTTEVFVSQSHFLTGIASRVWAMSESLGEWTPLQGRQFQTLTHPDHLGRSFRVLVQSARS